MAETKNNKKNKKKVAAEKGGDAVGPTYFIGLIGAAVYYIQQADGFGEILVALLKALVWPAYFVYEVLKYVGA